MEIDKKELQEINEILSEYNQTEYDYNNLLLKIKELSKTIDYYETTLLSIRNREKELVKNLCEKYNITERELIVFLQDKFLNNG